MCETGHMVQVFIEKGFRTDYDYLPKRCSLKCASITEQYHQRCTANLVLEKFLLIARKCNFLFCH